MSQHRPQGGRRTVSPRLRPHIGRPELLPGNPGAAADQSSMIGGAAVAKKHSPTAYASELRGHYV